MLEKLFSCRHSITPMPVEKWSLIDNDKSPWPNKVYKPVTILETKAGWVRFSMGSDLFNDERMLIERFIRIYKPCQGDIT